MKNKQRPYQKPRLKSSKIKTISFYGRRAARTPAEIEFLLAEVIS